MGDYYSPLRVNPMPIKTIRSIINGKEVASKLSPFGLGAGIMTKDISRAHRVADQIQAGNIWINSYNLLPPGLPFGGSKQSGFGREGSIYAMEAYSEVKAVYVQL